ncbi:hypothetical protein MLD52_08605 [Puniceicoccaceae bacterium K14]|nr:hypothetical protein [Puniceicoccaceae bacterium K14]
MKKAGVKIVTLSYTNLDHCKTWKRKYAESISLIDELFTSNEMGMKENQTYGRLLTCWRNVERKRKKLFF